MIFTNDHAAAHVRVIKAGSAIKVDLLTLHAFDVQGETSNREVSRAEELVRQHADEL